MTDSRRRKTGFAGWWAQYAGSVAFVALILFGAVGFFVVDDTIDSIQAERLARTDSITGVLGLFCSTDNDQDALLADLIEVSLSGGSFGANIDPDELTPFEQQVIVAVAHVQQLAQRGPPTPQERVFRRKLKQLRDPLACDQIIARFLAGEPIPPPEPQ